MQCDLDSTFQHDDLGSAFQLHPQIYQLTFLHVFHETWGSISYLLNGPNEARTQSLKFTKDFLGSIRRPTGFFFQAAGQEIIIGLSNCKKNKGRKRICVLREDIMAAQIVFPSHHVTLLIDFSWSS